MKTGVLSEKRAKQPAFLSFLFPSPGMLTVRLPALHPGRRPQPPMEDFCLAKIETCGVNTDAQ